MGKTIFMVTCLAGESFLVYCLIQFVLESRRSRRLAKAVEADLPNWFGPRSVVPFKRERAGARRSSPAAAGTFSSPASRDAITSIEVRRRA